jgi:hypothetical protein
MSERIPAIPAEVLHYTLPLLAALSTTQVVFPKAQNPIPLQTASKNISKSQKSTHNSPGSPAPTCDEFALGIGGIGTS